MSQPDRKERFSRQTILPGVGEEGQIKWGNSSLLLVGEGPALDAAGTALNSSGLLNWATWDPREPQPAGNHSLALVLTEDPNSRREASRTLRSRSQPALFAWPSNAGFGLLLATHSGGKCPCLECFVSMNPKVFGSAPSALQRVLGTVAASEALLWVLRGTSPLSGHVQLHSLEGGLVSRQEVGISVKCPAPLAGVDP